MREVNEAATASTLATIEMGSSDDVDTNAVSTGSTLAAFAAGSIVGTVTTGSAIATPPQK